MISLIFCIVAIVVLLVLLGFSVYFNVKFGLIILRVQDAIEVSLDILDERYASISNILQIPIFHDSKEVRQVIKDIDFARKTILDVAGELTTIDEVVEEAEE